MQRNFLQSFFKIFFTCLFALIFTTLPFLNLYAHDGVRSGVSFDSGDNICDTGGLEFDPFSSGNKDILWQIDNPTCASYVAAVGASIVGATFASGNLCGDSAIAIETSAQVAAGVPMSPVMIKDRVKEAGACSTMLSAGNYGQAAACCGAAAATATTFGIAVAALSVIWDVADITYKNARICGHKWSSWEREAISYGPATHNVWKKKKGPHRKCLEKIFLDGAYMVSAAPECNNYIGRHPADSSKYDHRKTVANKSYRELIYGGIEFDDNGDDACGNPASWDANKRLEILGYNSSKQKYYMTGASNTPVYACHRFLSADRNDQAAKQAYECCKFRSQNALCIENRTGLGSALGPYEHKFCNLGSRCIIKNVTFEVYESRKQPNYLCAKTYSVCPYNHPLGGGTEEEEMEDFDNSVRRNHCQFMNHCAKAPLLPHVRQTDFEGAYISSACKDLKGDSQNFYEYSAQLLPVTIRNFSAPMVQCFKETMENIFLHKAGETVCLDPDEFPDINDQCLSGYKYKKGEDLPGKSFFLKIQDRLQGVIKMGVTLAILFVGIATLFAVPGTHFSRKQLLPFIIKIGLVMYFAIGDGWQFGFMKGVLDSSSYLANITFRPYEVPTKRTVVETDDDGNEVTTEVTVNEIDKTRLDGCQFPRFDYSDNNIATKYENPKYPPGKEYLRIWDTLDCKLAKALGFGPEVSVPNLLFMMLAGFFTGGFGIVFFVASFIFGFLLLSLVVKAIHIFLMSTTAVVILIYVSPITITLAMFKRTKGIFDQWWKQLLGYTLQPLILFAYLGIFIMLFDGVIAGKDLTYSAGIVDGVEDSYGRREEKTMNCIGDAKNTSVYCIFRRANIDTYSGLEKIGIGIPFLTGMNQDKLNTLIKGGLIMFILSKFIDQISTLAAKLVGGNALQSDWNMNLASKSYKTLRGIQKRGMRLGKSLAAGVARKGVGAAKSAGRTLGTKGRAVADMEARSGVGDTTGRSAGSSTTSSSQGSSGTSKSNDGGSDTSGSTGNSGGSSSTGKSS